MRRNSASIVLILILFLVAMGFGLSAHAKEDKQDKKNGKSVDSITNIAVVNGTVIPRADYEKEVAGTVAALNEQAKANGKEEMLPEKIAELKKKMLEVMVNRELMIQDARKKAIKVAPDEVTAQIDKIKQRMGSEETFNRQLTASNTTETDLRAQFEKILYVNKLIEKEIAPKVSVTEDESKAFYDANPTVFKLPERFKVSHILVKMDANADKDAKAKAHKTMEAIQKRIKKGEDFATVAKEVSEDPSTKPNGGELVGMLDGYIAKGQAPPPFEQAALALKPGGVSDIVETPMGLHLIKLTDKKEESILPYDQVREKLEQRMKQEKTGQMTATYIDELKKKAKIQTFE